ncbi:MAG TPA: phenylalanine--tRNA ligase subunit beta [Clostridiales bacterium]|nr:phenylalanine--tRNA ligase subunit beta [Clostridiales bacterium]
MKLSKKWLKNYFDFEMSDKEFADAMTLSGSKVEALAYEGEGLKNIVVGEIIDIKKHENADKLSVCKVNVGDGEIAVVTGAQNIKAGDFVPVAKDGATVHGGKQIIKGELRGVLSEGMLCSLAELGLTVNDFPYAIEDGIFILGDDCEKVPGKDIREAIGLNDLTVEFEITSNRPDCLSVIGLAREAAGSFGKKFTDPEHKEFETVKSLENLLDVEIHDSSKCYRYVGAVVKDVKIGPSPRWMRERLRASGVRPINNIVDITNYVMLELGQPMHAFDIRYLKGNKVNVRRAVAGETIVTLDGLERMLNPDMLVIADAETPVAVAGVMGGEYSGVMDDTETVVFESACFNGASVRSTAKELGMRTESSARFEKELDPNGCLKSMAFALELVEKLGAGKVIEQVVDCKAFDEVKRTLEFDWEWINGFIGIDLSREEQMNILENIGFIFEGDKVIIPSFRKDIEHKADLAEEIARFYGYENIPNVALTGVADGKLSEKQAYEKLISNTLLSLGYSEIQTYSFINEKAYDKIGLEDNSKLRNCVRLLNPLSEDTAVMRTTPLPSMLDALTLNFSRRNLIAKLFELATVYKPTNEPLPFESQKVILAGYGAENDFWAVKGDVEELLKKVGIMDFRFETTEDLPYLHPGRAAKIMAYGNTLGFFGEIHPSVQERYDIGMRITLAQLDFNSLIGIKNLKRNYSPLPKFPAIERDLALVCDKKLAVQTIKDLITTAAGELLEKLELFDIYEGAQIAQDKKSVAFNLVFRSHIRTLNDKDADSAMQSIIETLKTKDISLRD